MSKLLILILLLPLIPSIFALPQLPVVPPGQCTSVGQFICVSATSYALCDASLWGIIQSLAVGDNRCLASAGAVAQSPAQTPSASTPAVVAASAPVTTQPHPYSSSLPQVSSLPAPSMSTRYTTTVLLETVGGAKTTATVSTPASTRTTTITTTLPQPSMAPPPKLSTTTTTTTRGGDQVVPVTLASKSGNEVVPTSAPSNSPHGSTHGGAQLGA